MTTIVDQIMHINSVNETLISIFVLETIDMFAPNAFCSWKIIGQSITKSVLLVAIWYARFSQPVDIAKETLEHTKGV